MITTISSLGSWGPGEREEEEEDVMGGVMDEEGDGKEVYFHLF